MRARLNNLPLVHHADTIHCCQATEAMGHHDYRLTLTDLTQQRQYLLFGGGIQAFGGLIKQPQIAVVQQGARNGQATQFASRQRAATFAHPRVEPFIMFRQMGESNLMQDCIQLFITGGRVCQQQIIA